MMPSEIVYVKQSVIDYTNNTISIWGKTTNKEKHHSLKKPVYC
jgi:hypothetical protein